MLEATTRATPKKKVEAKSQPSVKQSSSYMVTVKPKCHFCQSDHVIYYYKNLWHFRYHKGQRKFANFASIACALLLMHQINAPPVNTRSARRTTIRCFIYLQQRSSTNTDKEVASKAIPPPSILTTHPSTANKSCFRLRLYSSATATTRAKCAELCWIANRKQTSYPRNLSKI